MEEETYDETEPWDSPANRALLASSYFFTDEDAKDWVPNGRLFPDATILAITGPGTAFGDGGRDPPEELKTLPPSTIIAVESRASGISWPAPGDFDIRTMPRTICAPDGKGISSRNPGGFFVIFADCRLWLLLDKTPFEALAKLFTIEEAKKNDREKLLAPYVIDRGGHWSDDWSRSFSAEEQNSGRGWHKRGMEEWKKAKEKSTKKDPKSP